MKKILKKIYDLNEFPFFLLFALELLAHFFMTMTIGDDIPFSEIYKTGVLSRLSWGYENWSTRLLIEGVYYNLYRFPFGIWKMIDSSLIVLIGYSISKLFVYSNKRKNNYIIVCLILIYPLTHMVTAGWIATSANYTWAIALGLYALIPLQKLYSNNKVKWYQYVFATLALLYGSNAEQMACILWGGLVLLLVYQIWKMNVKAYHILQLFVVSGMLIFKVTGPSNSNVVKTGAEQFFPDWFTLNFIDKLYLGFTTFAEHFLGSANMIFLVLLVTIFAGVWMKRKLPVYRIIAAIPICILSFLTIFRPLTSIFMPSLPKAFEGIQVSLKNFNHAAEYLPFVVYILLCVLICVSIYIFYGNHIKSLIGISLFGIAMMSRIMIGFTSTVYASDMRTYAGSYFLFIILIVILIHDTYAGFTFQKRFEELYEKIYCFSLVILAAMSYFNLLLSL